MQFCGKLIYQEHFFPPKLKTTFFSSKVLLGTNIALNSSKSEKEQKNELKKIVEKLTTKVKKPPEETKSLLSIKHTSENLIS